MIRKYFEPGADGALLMWDMVQAMDIDLTEAVACDRLRYSTLKRMLKRCNRCPDPQSCGVFLSRRDGRVACAPSFCPNRDRLARLRQTFPPHPVHPT